MADVELVNVDYEALLIKYIAHVRAIEGSDYLSALDETTGPCVALVVGFSAPETHALRVASHQAVRFLEERR